MAESPFAKYPLATDVAPMIVPQAPAAGPYDDPHGDYVGPPPGGPTLSAAPGEKYRAAALAELDRRTAQGASPGGGYVERLARGATAGLSDELLAMALAPGEMVRHRTINPIEGYRYGKAIMDLRGEETDKETAGLLGTGTEVLGAAVGPGKFLGAGTRASARIIPRLGVEVPASAMQFGKNVGKGVTVGGVEGFGHAKTLEDAPQQTLMGGILGGGLAAAAPAVTGTVGRAARGFQYYGEPSVTATRELADKMRAAGVTPEIIRQRIEEAHAAGQPFSIANAIGKEGHRALTAQAKTPGAQRQEIYETLTARQLAMPHRVGPTLQEGLSVPAGTADMARDSLQRQAARLAAPVYREAEGIPTWSNRLQDIMDDPIARTGLRHGEKLQRLTAKGRGEPYDPKDLMITGFNEAGDPIITGVPNVKTLHALKMGLDKMIEKHADPITGRLDSTGYAINEYKKGLVREMAAINPTYARANQIYGGPMQVRDAIEEGRAAVTHGRSADNIARYREMSPTEQMGYRIGYADKAQEQLERTGNLPSILREKVPKGQAELAELSQRYGPERLRGFLNREETMERGFREATGGSHTAENLADMAAGNAAVDVAAAMMSGNPMGALRSGWGHFANVASGQREATRLAIARALMANQPEEARQLMQQIEQYERGRGVNLFGGRPVTNYVPQRP